MKNLVFLLLTFFLASFSISAQCKANNFSGNWILNKTSSKIKFNAAEIRILITQSGKDCSIERNGSIQIFSSNTYVKDSDPKHPIIARLTFIDANKFSITTTIGSPLSKSRVSEYIEYWTISDNGKKLVIESQSRSYHRDSNIADFSSPRYTNPDFSAPPSGSDTGSYFSSRKTVYTRK